MRRQMQLKKPRAGGLRSEPRLMIAGILVAGFFCSVTGVVQAQTTLRWKLSAGDAFKVHVEQQTTSDVSFSGKKAVTQIDLTIDLAWKVAAADAEGFQITQAIERLQLKMTPAKGIAVAYDSADEKRLTGAAKDLESALKPLVGAEVEIVMSDRGEIRSAKIASAAEAAAEDSADAAASATQPAFSAAAVEQLLKQSLVVLPKEEVAAGDTWTTISEITSALGEFKQQTTYEMGAIIISKGQEEVGIGSTTKLVPVTIATTPKTPIAKTGTKPSLKSHEQSGRITFLLDAGRVAHAESTQKLVTERPYRDTTIVVTLSSQQTTTLEPVQP